MSWQVFTRMRNVQVTKEGDAPLHFQKGFLHRVFRVARRAQQMTRQVLHPRALQAIQLLVRL